MKHRRLFTYLISIWLMCCFLPVGRAMSQEEPVVLEGRIAVSSEDGIAGLGGVRIVFASDSGGSVTETTNSEGIYSHEVPIGWTGSVTPRKPGFTFAPGTQRYEGVTDSLSGQDYIATPGGGMVTISGGIADEYGAPISGVLLEFTGDIDGAHTDGYE